MAQSCRYPPIARILSMLLCCVALALMLYSTPVHCETLVRGVVGGGATRAQAGDTVVLGTVGQAAMQAERTGFWYVFLRTLTPVEIISTQVSSVDGAVIIAWETGTEQDHLGFHVERAEADAETYERITRRLIRPASDRNGCYEFTDHSVLPGKTYVYRLAAIDIHGETQLIDLPPVTVARSLPTSLALRQNTPNPFNPRTWIVFALPGAFHTSLRIYDISGRCVRTLLDERLEREIYSVEWDGHDDRGNRVASGVYLYRLQAGPRAMTRKLVVLE